MTATLKEIWRYPIKSMQGESISATDLVDAGVFADRTMGLRDQTAGKVLSAKHPFVGEQLLTMAAEFVEPPKVGEPIPVIRVHVDGSTLLTTDIDAIDQRCTELLGLDVHLETAGAGSATEYESYWPEVDGTVLSDVALDLPAALAARGSFADLEPLHILTTSSLRALADLLPDSDIAIARFRPGLLLDTASMAESGFIESDWNGRTAKLGGSTIKFGEPTPRCIMPTHAQPGLDKDRSILRTLARNNLRPFGEFGNFASLGVYAQVVEPGPIAVGDQLVFE